MSYVTNLESWEQYESQQLTSSLKLKEKINKYLKEHKFRSDLDRLYELHCAGKDNRKLVKLLKEKGYGYSKNPWNLRWEVE